MGNILKACILHQCRASRVQGWLIVLVAEPRQWNTSRPGTQDDDLPGSMALRTSGWRR